MTRARRHLVRFFSPPAPHVTWSQRRIRFVVRSRRLVDHPARRLVSEEMACVARGERRRPICRTRLNTSIEGRGRHVPPGKSFCNVRYRTRKTTATSRRAIVKKSTPRIRVCDHRRDQQSSARRATQADNPTLLVSYTHAPRASRPQYSSISANDAYSDTDPVS